MNDLISRKALFEDIQANSYRLTDRCNSFGQGMFLDGIKQAIDNQPTAYDPDKVIEVLNCWREEQRKSADELSAEYSNSHVKIVIVNEVMKLVDDIIGDVIEVVKKGGVG